VTPQDDLDAMLSKARRYLGSAEMLRCGRDYDSAVSRLYYAMFFCAEALLFARGLTFSSHRAVISAFAQHFVKPKLLPATFHSWLLGAFDKRQVSEYGFRQEATESDVLGLEAKAQQFLEKREESLRAHGHL